MQALQKRQVRRAVGKNMPTVFAAFLSVTLTACNSLVNREPPSELGITQKEAVEEYQPREYVFCDMNGGPWGCSSVTRKTPVSQAKPGSDGLGPLGQGGGSQEGGSRIEVGDRTGRMPDSKRMAAVKAGPGYAGVILFDFDSDVLLPHAEVVLANLLDSLRGKTLRIRGYTDSVGGESYNDSLALRRAQSVRNYLIEAGFPEADLSVEGEGLCCYITGNDSEEQRRRNRRVEIYLPKTSA